MWRIVRFLGRFGNLLLFLLLESVALAVIVNVNKPHREISQDALLEMSGGVSEAQESISSYFNLATENELLMARTADLQAQLIQLRDSLDVILHRKPDSLHYVAVEDSVKKDSAAYAKWIALELPDSLMPVSGYKFIPARAVNNSVNKNYNYITLNKGTNHGVTMDMGVISPEGIAGQIVSVSANYSLALSVLNKKFRSGARLLNNPDVGTLVWEGNDANHVLLEFIPQTSKIHIGDTVVTSGYSTVFPRNYMIGTVENYDMRAQDGFFSINVKLSTNFRALHNVFLVRHEYKMEIDSLEMQKQE